MITYYHTCKGCGHEIECEVDVLEKTVEIPTECEACGQIISAGEEEKIQHEVARKYFTEEINYDTD